MCVGTVFFVNFTYGYDPLLFTARFRGKQCSNAVRPRLDTFRLSRISSSVAFQSDSSISIASKYMSPNHRFHLAIAITTTTRRVWSTFACRSKAFNFRLNSLYELLRPNLLNSLSISCSKLSRVYCGSLLLRLLSRVCKRLDSFAFLAYG